MYFDSFEPAESQVVREALSGGDVVIDVGAHVGWFTTLAAQLVGPEGQVYAFEAYPNNSERLRRNVVLNGCKNVCIRQAGVSNSEGILGLGPQDGSDSGSVTFLERSRHEVVSVSMVTLDSALARDSRRVALLKIDVEGFEAKVLEGASEVLNRTDQLLIEINPRALSVAGASSETLREALRIAGLTSWSAIQETGLRRLRRQGTVVNYIVRR